MPLLLSFENIFFSSDVFLCIHICLFVFIKIFVCLFLCVGLIFTFICTFDLFCSRFDTSYNNYSVLLAHKQTYMENIKNITG